MLKNKYWNNFNSGIWKEKINVRDFIIKNYKPYDGNYKFLSKSTEKTNLLWTKCTKLIDLEFENNGVLDIDANTISGIDNYKEGFIDKNLEIIVGLQTDKPLKRSILPYGGIRMIKNACKKYNFELSEDVENIFTKYRKTHNDGVFSAYTNEMKKARKSGIITGLPDAYGRGRIIGDYRRVALYGTNFLISQKETDLENLSNVEMNEENIRTREEVNEQIKSLFELTNMAKKYGFDISEPAKNSFEAIQWTYFAFLGSVKETNGAANSLGRVSTFFDIYISRDLKNKSLTESEAQELIDQFVIKLRLIRHLRTPEYNDLFAGDPVWITESIGGTTDKNIHMVTKSSYRFLQTLYNLGPSPEPNLTILWSENLPKYFKEFCAKISIDTSSIQYENDDLMKNNFSDDCGISCCVSGMEIGKNMQYFGARCNLPKLLLLSLNGGKDEITGEQIGPLSETYKEDYLDYEKVLSLYKNAQKWLTSLYVNTMNIIHYMHDKYAYERLMMALHDTKLKRFMAFGIAGLSVITDSLSAIKYSKVRVIRNKYNLITDFETIANYPKFGNDDDRVDDIAKLIITDFFNNLKKHKTYRNSKHSLSILTITSNVVYGKKTGSTPDGRKIGEPFAPGANPMHGRDNLGALATLNSVSKLPFKNCLDGVSLTLTLVPKSLGRDYNTRLSNLASMLDGYFYIGGHHLNINVLEKELLENAMKNPYKYPQLTIRVSGYAVNFIKLTKEQQLEVISRTFHSNI
ncbi:MAG: formate C-acetyltransferase [Clostridiales bacterium]